MSETKSCDYFILWGREKDRVDEMSFPSQADAERYICEESVEEEYATIVKVVEQAHSMPNPMGKPTFRWTGQTP